MPMTVRPMTNWKKRRTRRRMVVGVSEARSVVPRVAFSPRRVLFERNLKPILVRRLLGCDVSVASVVRMFGLGKLMAAMGIRWFWWAAACLRFDNGLRKKEVILLCSGLLQQWGCLRA